MAEALPFKRTLYGCRKGLSCLKFVLFSGHNSRPRNLARSKGYRPNFFAENFVCSALKKGGHQNKMPAPTRTSPIDIVNAQDESVGTIERGEALDRGANFRTAHIFLFGNSGDLLLQQLASTRKRHPLRWGSSVAAYLNSGESYEEAARRRLGEELDLQLPLMAIGKIEMLDERSRKFVSLFTAHNGTPTIHEHDHIESLAFWPLDRLDRAVEMNPERFTPTFRALYRAFGEQLR